MLSFLPICLVDYEKKMKYPHTVVTCRHTITVLPCVLHFYSLSISPIPTLARWPSNTAHTHHLCLRPETWTHKKQSPGCGRTTATKNLDRKKKENKKKKTNRLLYKARSCPCGNSHPIHFSKKKQTSPHYSLRPWLPVLCHSPINWHLTSVSQQLWPFIFFSLPGLDLFVTNLPRQHACPQPRSFPAHTRP